MESALETSKLRKITLLYYLEDHSIQISEPRQMNSGTPQGIFLKRQTVSAQFKNIGAQSRGRAHLHGRFESGREY